MKPLDGKLGRAAAFGALAALTVAFSGCYPLRRAEPIVGPMALSDPHLLRGRLLYDRWCYKCHLEGEGGMSPALNDKPLPRPLIRLQVRVGLGAMPAFGPQQISDDELDAIADYVVALRHHHAR